MFFHIFPRKRKKPDPIQHEYVELIRYIQNSPLWDGTDEEILRSLPGDLTKETLFYAKKEDHSV